MNSIPTGGGLLPDVVFHVPPQAGGADGVKVLAYPFIEVGATPPLNTFRTDQSELHQVRVVVGPAAATPWAPSTKSPTGGNANTIAVDAVPPPKITPPAPPARAARAVLGQRRGPLRPAPNQSPWSHQAPAVH